MLDQETKRRIDNARDILVGKVPDPKSQVEQITIALIYKFMDDIDKSSEELGGEAQFFTDDFKQYAWSRLMDTKLSGQERLNLYTEGISKLGTHKNLPQLFRDIFKGAFLPYRDPNVLHIFLKEINGFTYDHSENLGNAFEYLLSIMGSQGDAGQFRTSRHIIDFIVDVVNPKKDETVLDPACGTAGFLISAYKHILQQHDGKNDPENKEKPLTPDEREKLMEHFVGYDISPDMVRLSLVNMYLHGFQGPKIFEYDTLGSEDRWDERYDVILANPPFMTPKGGVRPHRRFSIQANKAEVLFVDYILEHLTSEGRAGIIIPEGIVFINDTPYKNLRKMLVEEAGLYAVASLPAGVFNPYSNVKTSILFLDKKIGKLNSEILFLKVGSDGFDLGAQRRKIESNDLPKALEIITAWKSGISPNGDLALLVKKDKVAENGNYRLSGDFYKESTEMIHHAWPMVELGDVLDYEQPTKYIVDSVDYNDEFETPVLTAGKTFILGRTNETEGIFKEKLPVIIFDDFTTATKYVDFPFKVKSSAMKILHADKDKIDIRFAFYSMQKIVFPVNEHKRYWISEYSKIKIPLPPLDIQKKIIDEIEVKQQAINSAKELIRSLERERRYFGRSIAKLEDVEWVELGSVCETSSGGTPLKNVKEYYENGTVPWIKSGEVNQGVVCESEEKITEAGLKESSAKLFPKNTVLIAMYGATAGKVGLLKIEASTNQAICGVLPNEKYIPEFLYYYLRTRTDDMARLSQGGAQPNISQTIIKKMLIPVIAIEDQIRLVAEMDEDESVIRNNVKIIQKYQKKIDDVIADL